MKRESEAEKRFDEILRRMPNAKPLSRAGISQDFCQRSPRGNQFDAIFGYTFGYRHQFGLFRKAAQMLVFEEVVLDEGVRESDLARVKRIP
jgi:hypothetical protein